MIKHITNVTMQKKTLLSIVVCFTMTTLYAQKTEPADTLKGQTLDEVVVAQDANLSKMILISLPMMCNMTRLHRRRRP